MANLDTSSKIQQIKQGLTDFVRTESELARAEIVPAAKHAGVGAGLFGGAAAFAFHALWMIIIAIALAIGWLLDSVTALGPWGSFTLGFLITALFSLIVAAILAKIGQSQMKKVTKPEATITEARATISALSDALAGKPAERELAAQPHLEVHQAGATAARPRHSA